MPNRVLRDDILNSERYWSLSSDSCRMLFIHLVLRADDLGLFRAANYTIRATCFGVTAPSPEATAKMLTELNDADLIRMYKANGADYGMIPRFGQRLRILKPRYPLPPDELMDSEIKELISKMSDGRLSSVGPMSAEVKRSRSRIEVEVKGNQKKRTTAATDQPQPPIPPPAIQEQVKTFLEKSNISNQTKPHQLSREEQIAYANAHANEQLEKKPTPT